MVHEKLSNTSQRITPKRKRLSDPMMAKRSHKEVETKKRRRESTSHIHEIRALLNRMLRNRRGQRYDLRKADLEHTRRNSICPSLTANTCRQSPAHFGTKKVTERTRNRVSFAWPESTEAAITPVVKKS